MGLFQHKKDEEEVDGPLQFFDGYFREELRTRGREYFEKVIDDNATLLKKDLDAMVAKTNGDLQERIARQFDAAVSQISNEAIKQIDTQFVEYGRAMKEAQDKALEALEKREKALEEQYQQLSDRMQKSISEQEAVLVKTYQENMARITAMNEAQGLAVEMLNRSAQALDRQHQQLGALLEKSIMDQKEMVVSAFEDNMARVVEHYLLGALGDQYDLKAQLPSIMKQLEEVKPHMVEDIKL